MAEYNFNDIKNKYLPPIDFAKEKVYTKDHSFGKIFKVIPKKDFAQLLMKWTMPSSMAHP